MRTWSKRTRNRLLRVEALPYKPKSGGRYWIETTTPESDYTHYLFRYPAKFHRPVVRWALANHSKPASVVLDPFSGSGTLNVEALLSGRSSVGIDIDPLACFIARAKSTVLDPERLDKALERIKINTAKIARKEAELERLIGSDISRTLYERQKNRYWIPEIPNIEHWFKRHVIIDLAALLHILKHEVRLWTADRHFFLACYAAVIRRVSNADPTPVSGLEVTAVQAARNATREINVVDEFLRKSRLAIHGMRQLWSAMHHKGRGTTARILCGDAREIENAVTSVAPELLPFSLVITSPPYCNAVEYARRHKLEMYWLDLVPDTASHVELSRSYVGHRNLALRQASELRHFGIAKLDRALQRISKLSRARAISLERYFASMEKFFYELARVTERGADAICVIADSTCAGVDVPTSNIATELASDQFTLKSRFRYAIQNHHMQYGLRNGNGIREETVLTFRRR